MFQSTRAGCLQTRGYTQNSAISHIPPQLRVVVVAIAFMPADLVPNTARTHTNIQRRAFVIVISIFFLFHARLRQAMKNRAQIPSWQQSICARIHLGQHTIMKYWTAKCHKNRIIDALFLMGALKPFNRLRAARSQAEIEKLQNKPQWNWYSYIFADYTKAANPQQPTWI